MGDPISGLRQRSGSGIVQRVRLENFMCHSSLQIELGDWVNFITGQNGSGKSAILTALCVAFGSRAKGTQRASTLKDFIKTGCSNAVVQVELKNQGEDAFKPEIYGDIITVERRISGTTSATVLKDKQGRRVAARKEDLRELVEHFNIDVENPCVVMSQDKSREFLHSGNDKDKFKFFYKATLLQQVEDLLQNIEKQLEKAGVVVDELEGSIRPIERELNELQEKIKSMEHVEEISQKAKQLKKKLAWSWVYDVDKQLQEQNLRIVKLKDRVPRCQAKIDEKIGQVVKLRECFTLKKSEIDQMMAKTSEIRRMKDELQQTLTLATKEKIGIGEEYSRKANQIQKMMNAVRSLQQQIEDTQEQHAKHTQAEESAIEEKLKELQNEVSTVELMLTRLKEEESALSECIQQISNEIREINQMIQNIDKNRREISSVIRELRQNQTNKVTAFGGQQVIYLLQSIERHHQRFASPPIGPIGAHLTLNNGDVWGPAVEHAIGRLLNAFIVTNHKDSLLLRACAKEAKYNNVQIIIYDFSLPRLHIPPHMLPQTEHPTTLSRVHSENHTVLNVLVDRGDIERQVLVRDYDVGKTVAFDQRISNLKEVVTLDGSRMFSRGSVQTVLPPNKRVRTGRLCSSYDDQISDLERQAKSVEEEDKQCMRKKRNAEQNLQDLQEKLRNVKRRCAHADRDLASKRLALQDSAYAAEASTSPASTVDELHQEISKMQEEIQEKKMLLQKFRPLSTSLPSQRMAAMASKLMHAVQYDGYGGGASGLKHVEVPVPTPTKGEVLLKLEAASINPIDWKIQKGILRPFLPRKFPYAPVSDVAGEVVEVAQGVQKFKPGDKVVAYLSQAGGGLAEYAAATENLTVTSPPEVSAAEGAGLPIAGLTAHQCLTQAAGVKLDGSGQQKNILITAASGGVGQYAVQLAKLGNTHVTATCGARNIEFVKSLGADEVLDYKTPEGAALNSPSGRKYDAVVHCATGIPWSTFEPNLSANGKVIDITPSPSALVTFALKKLTFSKKQLVPLLMNAKAENLEYLVELVKEGKLRTVIDSTYPLSKAEDAWAKSISGHATGKIIVEK